jgi:VIT1/CCC1 family predicted Fe2+/Mn2+ transporter
LILGVAGAHPTRATVLIAGVAGLIGGAFSMASGEYVSMKAQRELLERELELERIEIHRRPEGERRELARIYESRGVDPAVANRLAAEMMRNPDLALETHAREELGINPDELGSPEKAAASSFGAFALGALVPLFPWFFTQGQGAIMASVLVGLVAAGIVGASLSAFTGRSWHRSAVRQLIVFAVPAAVLYGIGRLLGVSIN